MENKSNKTVRKQKVKKSQNYFGLEIKDNGKFDALNVAARLFLCPRITPEHAIKMVDMLEKGSITVEGFRERTNEFIYELVSLKNTPKGITSIMRNKLEAWEKILKAPTQEEYEYIETFFTFSKETLFGNEQQKQIGDPLKSPISMAAYVKQYVKGQDDAIDKLAVPFFLHHDSKSKKYTSRIKTPVLLMGPTGSGKSEMIRHFAKICDCPVIRINSSEITPTGWRGISATDVIARELRNGTTIDDLKYAIIVFHEFDKITHHNQNIIGTCGTDMDNDMMRDIMRFFETDHSLHLEDSTHPTGDTYRLPVDNLLIVFDGAFSGMENIIKKRLNLRQKVGFSQNSSSGYDESNLLQYVKTEDLEEWGYMPELLGRIGETVVLNPLSTDVIYEIMISAKESVLQSHIEFWLKNNIDLQFDEKALRYIASEAYKSGLGFRNVKALLAKALKSMYFNMIQSSSTQENTIVKISEEYIKEHLKVR